MRIKLTQILPFEPQKGKVVDWVAQLEPAKSEATEKSHLIQGVWDSEVMNSEQLAKKGVKNLKRTIRRRFLWRHHHTSKKRQTQFNVSVHMFLELNH